MSRAMYWSELAELTHQTQVAEFGFCCCEDAEEDYPYNDCTGGYQYD
jgi:hypothetical protein